MIRPVLISVFSRAGSAILNFGTMILLSRYLGAEGKGLSSKLVVLIAGVQVIADFLGGAALVYLASRHSLKNLLLPAWGWSVICSVSAAFILGTQADTQAFGWHFALLAFLNSTLNQHIHILNGRSAFGKGNFLTFAQAGLIFGATWLFLNKGLEFQAYIRGLYFGWAIPWLLSIGMLAGMPGGKYQEQGYRKAIISLLRYGSANQAGHFIQYFTQRIAFYLLPAFFLGIYSNAVTLSESLWMFASSVAVVQYGSIANVRNKKFAAGISLLFMKVVFLVTAFGGMILCLLPSSLYVRLFGVDFAEVSTVLPILYPGICMMSAYLIIGHYFSGTGRFMKNNYALLAGLGTSVAGYILVYFNEINLSMRLVAAISTFANGAIFFFVLWLFAMDTGYTIKDFLPGKKDWSDFRFYLFQSKEGI